VIGDTIYQSDKKYTRYIKLNLSNEHYTLKPNKSRTLVKSISNKERKPILYKTNGEIGKIKAYDGEKLYKDYSFEKIQDAKHKPLTSDIIYIKTHAEDIKEEYNNFIEDAEHLKNISNGLINLYKCGNDKHISKYLFHCMSKTVKEPEQLDEEEAYWIDNAFMGGIVWADDNTELDNATCYDVNSMYPALMATHKMTYPIGKGEFKKIDKLADIIPYGVYRATVYKSEDEQRNLNNSNLALERGDRSISNAEQGNSNFALERGDRSRAISNAELKNRQFRFNPKGYYTHYDLYQARRVGLTIELYDGINCLTFSKRISGHTLFKPFVDYLYKLKKQGEPRAKSFLNRLWGALCEKQTKTQTTLNGEVDLTGCYIQEILPYGTGYLVKSAKKEQIFSTPYARIAPFLTASARNMISEAMRPVIDRVKRVHTDGFIVDGKAKIITSKDLGDFKIEKQGKCYIHNSCKIDWLI
jgi:hypothetical protein